MPSVTVLVPTYRRPADLKRCLESIQKQIRLADEIIVIVRDTDTQTWAFLETFSHQLPLRTLKIEHPGVIAALNLGLDKARNDIISITDDDAVPHPDWLRRIEQHFLADAQLGGLGGRDWTYVNGKLIIASTNLGASKDVGRLQWFGRHIGNHHLGEGEPREIDILKGVNMSFRRDALSELRCDERLKGTGAQVHFEVALSLSLKQKGWKLVYDPAVAVDHYPAQRFDEDQRNAFNFAAWSNKVHNETLAILDYLPPLRRIVFLIWAVLIGTRDSFGLVQWIRFLLTEKAVAGQKLRASLQGRWQGWKTWQRSRVHKLVALNTKVPDVRPVDNCIK